MVTHVHLIAYKTDLNFLDYKFATESNENGHSD